WSVPPRRSQTNAREQDARRAPEAWGCGGLFFGLMSSQSDDIREEIRDRLRIEALIGQHVALRPSGRRFKGLCPFHAEKTPSFNVDPERQMWHCFGCGAGVDVFGFVQKIENLTFPEAVERLARQLGIPYERRGEG